MKTASYEELKSNPAQLDAYIQGEESVHLVSNGKAVALLTPLHRSEARQPVQWPDFAHRMKQTFGDRVLPAGTIQALIDEDRGER